MSFFRRASSSAAAAGDATAIDVSATPSASSSRRNSSSSPTPSVKTGAKSTMSALHQYLATFAKGLPKIDKTSGVLYTAEKGTSGKESTTKRTWHSMPKPEDFGIGPSRPTIVIPPPRERALARRGGGGSVVVKGWTDADIKAAAREFEIPLATSKQPPMAQAHVASMPMQAPSWHKPPAAWRGWPAPPQPHQMQAIAYAKKPAPSKKPRISFPDGCDDPNRVDSWNSRELERIIYELGGVQRGSVETKKLELRRLLAKYQKKPQSSSKP